MAQRCKDIRVPGLDSVAAENDSRQLRGVVKHADGKLFDAAAVKVDELQAGQMLKGGLECRRHTAEESIC